MQKDATARKIAATAPAYKIGESDVRPWGGYTVTNTGTNENGEEFCEKRITVNPRRILSLQSHVHRREYWRVERGVLDVVLDGQHYSLVAGNDIQVPLGSIHCMANTGIVPCVVYERQEGLCREDDIIRYADAYGRTDAGKDSGHAAASLAVYNRLLRQIDPSR